MAIDKKIVSILPALRMMLSEEKVKVAKISADAYGQDQEFYSFYRILEAYKQAFNNNQSSDMMVVKPDGDFFKYFHKKKSGNGAPPSAKAKDPQKQ